MSLILTNKLDAKAFSQSTITIYNLSQLEKCKSLLKETDSLHISIDQGENCDLFDLKFFVELKKMIPNSIEISVSNGNLNVIAEKLEKISKLSGFAFAHKDKSITLVPLKQSEMDLLNKTQNETIIKADENSLYTPIDVKEKVCEPQKQITKKPCKNCNCGLKNKVQKEEVVNQPIKSECGSCYLGDAFRCSNCPYKGQPAFLPGEKIKLDNVDFVVNKGEVKVVNDKDQKIKIDLDN